MTHRHPTLTRILLVACIVLPFTLSACTLWAPHPSAPPAHDHLHAAHGAHDATVHHGFADVGHWVAVFDAPGRDVWQKPAEVIKALDLRPGMRVADLGAGTGYFSQYLSLAVGRDGTVFAVDTEPNLVVHLRERSEKEHTENVVPILASPENPRLPIGSVDLVLIVDTFHHIDDRLSYFRLLRRYLQPKGRVAIIDWRKRDIPVGPPAQHKLARKQVLNEMQTAGYKLVAAPDILPYQYFLIFRLS